MQRHRSSHLASRSLNPVAALQFEPLEPRCVLSGVAELLLDINATPTAAGNNLSSYTQVNAVAYFTVGSFGDTSLWKTDGTEAGTTLVRSFESAGALTNVNGLLYFAASDSFGNRELWKSDGTFVGTSLVAEIQPGVQSSNPGALINVDGTLYFSANDGATGQELWKSDGGEAGTQRVADIRPGLSSSSATPRSSLGGALIFTANDGVAGNELWRTDGTEAGTYQLKDISEGTLASNPSDFIEAGGKLYFIVQETLGEVDLWVTDGSPASTTQVKEINPTGNDGVSSLANVNGTLYFAANDGVHGSELWKTDGTEAGTVLVRDIRSGDGSFPINLANVDGTLFFSAIDGVHGRELWLSDGTEAGTALVHDIAPGGDSYPVNLTNVGGLLYFSAADAVAGKELWKSDGTSDGTVRLKDILSGDQSSSISRVSAFGEKLLFAANDGSHGFEPWISDGTELGTILLKDVTKPTLSSFNPFGSVSNRVNVNGVHYFSAIDGVHGAELWRTDGTTAGTYLVKDIRTDGDSAIGNLINVNGILYFQANDGVHGRELWRSDGTVDGTFMVLDAKAGSASAMTGSSAANFANVNGILYFTADDFDHGLELWRSDGTAAGTVMASDFNVGSFSSSPTQLTVADGTLYFVAAGAQGSELWKIDAVTGLPTLVLDIHGAATPFPSRLTAAGDQLFFIANDGVAGTELWVADDDGARLVKDVRPGAASSNIGEMKAFGDQVAFVAITEEFGTEVWRSDGTDAGTYLLRDIRPGIATSSPRHLVNFNGVLYFSANDGWSGQELWKSDGTPTGTSVVIDYAESFSTNPFGGSQIPVYAVIGDWLYFVASPSLLGPNPSIYRISNSSSLPQLVNDAFPVVGRVSGPSSFANLNGELSFVGTTDRYGSELWIVREESLATAGDYTTDGVVDGADFLACQRSFNTRVTSPGQGADGSGNGVVNANDLTIWKDNFGRVTPSAPAAEARASLVAEDFLAAVDAAFASDSVSNIDSFGLAEQRTATPLPLGAAAIALRQAAQVDDLDRPASHVDREALVIATNAHRATTPEDAPAKRLTPPHLSPPGLVASATSRPAESPSLFPAATRRDGLAVGVSPR